MIIEQIYSSIHHMYHRPTYPWKQETSVANEAWPAGDCERGRMVHDKRRVVDSSSFVVVVLFPAAADVADAAAD